MSFEPMYENEPAKQELTEQQQFAINMIKNLRLVAQYIVNTEDWNTLDSLNEVMENVLSAAYTCKKNGKKFAIKEE